MKKREFATYVFKIFSVVIFVSAVSDVPYRLYYRLNGNPIGVLVTICLMTLLTVMLWFLAEWIAERIVVEDGDLNPGFQIGVFELTTCAMTILGMYLVVYGLLDFLTYLTRLFELRNSVRGDMEYEAGRFAPGLIFNVLKAFLGGLLISKANGITSFIIKHRNKA